MSNGYPQDMKGTTEQMSNLHPTIEYRRKQTPHGSLPDETDELDKRKLKPAIIIIHLNHIHVTLKYKSFFRVSDFCSFFKIP